MTAPSPTADGAKAVADTLRAARALIERPEAWTKNTWARDAHGNTDPGQQEATCWCLFGSMLQLELPSEEIDAAYEVLKEVVGDTPIEWNDAPERTHADVLSALDEAIRRAESAP